MLQTQNNHCLENKISLRKHEIIVKKVLLELI